MGGLGVMGKLIRIFGGFVDIGLKVRFYWWLIGSLLNFGLESSGLFFYNLGLRERLFEGESCSAELF